MNSILKMSFILLLLISLIGCTDWNIDPEDVDIPDTVSVSITGVSDSSVTIRWTESLDDNFLSYTVFYDDESPVDPVVENTVDTILLKQDTHKTIKNLTPNTRYYFRVSVNSTLGTSSYSTEVDTFTFDNILNKALTLNPIDTTKLTDTTVWLSWSKNWTDGYFGKYVVYYDTTTSVDTNDVAIDTVDVDSTTITGLITLKNYSFRIYQLRDGVPATGSNCVTVTMPSIDTTTLY